MNRQGRLYPCFPVLLSSGSIFVICQKTAVYDIIAARGKEAAAKLTFTFHAALTSKCPMKSDRKREARMCEFR